ncbi:MAG: transposase [Deltaproteobacteria bacterium]|nr:MAG: transposase [Deltaproteobacteria bacterium]
MGYRKVDKGISFAEGALLRSMEHNCSGEMMERINTVVGWENRAALLREYYPTGQSYEGADRYPPLMVVNGMVLQKWLPIPSDPELGNQIKDRISFKKFPGLPCDKPSPDHAPFSRFRSGPLTCSRDMKSDRTVRDKKPHSGLKGHASVDTTNGFIRATTMTPASVHESTSLPSGAGASSHTEDPIKTGYADTGYYGRTNRGFPSLNGITDGIMRKDTTTAKLTDRERERNRQVAKKRSIVEQYFGLSHLHDGA